MIGVHFAATLYTILHVLSNCQVALDQGRFTWRHNSVLMNIVTLIRPVLSHGMRLYSDMHGFLAPGGGSIPPDIIATNLRPEIFFVNESTGEVIIFELTCPWDTNIDRSHNFQEEKISPLVADLSCRFRTYQFSVEISVRGQVTNHNKSRLKAFTYRVCSEPKKVFSSIVQVCSKIALLSSFSIFTARNEPSWTDPSLLIHH